MQKWLVFGVIGLLMGVFAFFIDLLVESLVLFKWGVT